mgnify:CR=1 FL=1
MAGAEVNLYLTAVELKARGHDVAILHGPGTGKDESRWNELFESRFAPGSSGGDAVRNAVVRFHPDAIYIHKMAELSVLKALVASEIPVVRMVHDHDLYCMRSYKYFPLSRKICSGAAGWRCVFPCGAVIARNRGGRFPFRWMSFSAKRRELELNRRFARMVVATDFMRTELLRNGFHPARIEVHAPVPRSTETHPQSTFSSRNRILYTGQIIRGKGVDVLLEALTRVRSSFECIIVGDGSHRAHCEQLAQKLGLGDRVQFTGYVPSDKVAEFYGDASVAVVSSVWPEPFGAVGLEAMRFGVPVVAFDAGGIREWLFDGQNGFLVPWMDRNTFAQRIDQLLTDKDLARRMGENGRRIARERFGFEQYIDGLERMFARLVEAPQTAAVR